MDETQRSPIGKWRLALIILAWSGVALAVTGWYSIRTGFGTNGVSSTLPATGFNSGLAVDVNDAAGHIYSLVSAKSDDSADFLGPYVILRRTSGGSIDTSFASNGLIAAFPNNNASADPRVELSAICIDPTSHDLVVAGKITRHGTAGGSDPQEMIVEKLIPPAAGNGTASLDSSFNPSATGSGTPGVVVLATQYKGEARRCQVGGDGTVLLVGDDQPPSGGGSPAFAKVTIAKISGSGTPLAFGRSGVAEFFLPGSSGALNPEIESIGPPNPNATGNNDFLIAGDAYDPASASGSGTMLAAVDYCTGALDRKLNGTGVILSATLDGHTYTDAILGRILDNGSVAATLVQGGSGATPPYPANLVTWPYPLAAGGSPSSTLPGGITLPGAVQDFHSPTTNAGGNLIGGGNNASNREVVCELFGQAKLGFTPAIPPAIACPLPTTPPAFTRLYTFSAANPATHVNGDGIGPTLLIAGIDGNLYGTAGGGNDPDPNGVTLAGGANDTGTVFKVTRGGALTVLHTFSAATDTANVFGHASGPNADGALPGFPLAQGPDGTLYGVTLVGGAHGAGTVFRMAPNGSDFSSIYSFSAPDTNGLNTDGCFPFKGLIVGQDGNLYGTTHDCGLHGHGTLYRITPDGALTVLVAFQPGVNGKNAQTPFQDNDGILYGETGYGGANGSGTIFKVHPDGTGFSTLYNFSAADASGFNADGVQPLGGLVKGPDGQLYGGTGAGGPNGSGTVFKISTGGSFTTLHAFSRLLSNGTNPDGAGATLLAVAGDGSFYGTTGNGLSGANNAGALFRITPSGDFRTVFSFPALDAAGANASGAFAFRGLTLGTDGDIYGSALGGGSNGTGTIFRLTASGVLPKPALAIAAALPTVTIGMSDKVQWDTDGADTCTSSGNWGTGSFATSGTRFVKPGSTGIKFYKLTCTNGTGSAARAATVDVIDQPLAPGNLATTRGNAQLTLKWNAAFSATSYNVYQGTAPGGEGTNPVRTGITGTSTTISGLINGTRYYFEVSALNGSGEGAKSNEASDVPLPAPTAVKATAGNGQVTVSWNAVPGAASYRVYQGTTPGGEGVAAVKKPVATSTTITGLINGTPYYFKVAAVIDDLVGPTSAEVTATPAP